MFMDYVCLYGVRIDVPKLFWSHSDFKVKWLKGEGMDR